MSKTVRHSSSLVGVPPSEPGRGMSGFEMASPRLLMSTSTRPQCSMARLIVRSQFVRAGRVSRNRLDRVASLRKLVSQRAQVAVGQRGNHHLRPGLGEDPRDALSDPARRAGHDHGPSRDRVLDRRHRLPPPVFCKPMIGVRPPDNQPDAKREKAGISDQSPLPNPPVFRIALLVPADLEVPPMYINIDGLRVSQSDVRQLSSQWRGVLETMEHASSGLALRVLSAIVKSYLRGRGCRMGNVAGLVRHYDKAATLTTTVMFDATRRFEEVARYQAGIHSYLKEVVKG